MTFDEKRELLRRYRKLPNEIAANRELLAHLKSESERATANLISDGSAWTGVNADKMASIVERMLETQEKILEMELQSEEMREKIPQAIAKLKNADEKRVLVLHYIRGFYYYKICPIMHYSERQLKRLACCAVEHLDL